MNIQYLLGPAQTSESLTCNQFLLLRASVPSIGTPNISTACCTSFYITTTWDQGQNPTEDLSQIGWEVRNPTNNLS